MNKNVLSYFLILLLIALLGIFSCSFRRFKHKQRSSVDLEEVIAKDNTIVESSNDLGFKLLRAINQQGREQNFMISPFSTDLVVLMLGNGASGQTLRQIKEFLGINKNISQLNPQIEQLIEQMPQLDNRVTLKIANSQWINREFNANINQNYRQILKKYFDTQLFIVPFNMKTARKINDWVSSQTDHKITDIINGLKPEQAMVLVNAIYFKGQWYDKFSESETKNRKFYIAENQVVSIPTMSDEISKVNMFYDERRSTLVAELLYGKGQFSMVIMMPDFTFGLDSLIIDMNADLWNEYVNQMDEMKNVNVTMPKFEMIGTFDFVSLFKALGLSIIFDKSRADFSRIGQNLYVDDIRQKTYIKVDEKGSVAAAATSVTLSLTAAYPQTEEIKINKPFIFAIRQTSTNTILFLGVIRNPALLQ